MEGQKEGKEDVHPKMSTPEVRPIIRALANPERRLKLRKICESLNNHRVLEEVYFGCGKDPTPMASVAELLKAFDD